MDMLFAMMISSWSPRSCVSRAASVGDRRKPKSASDRSRSAQVSPHPSTTTTRNRKVGLELDTEDYDRTIAMDDFPELKNDLLLRAARGDHSGHILTQPMIRTVFR